MVASFRKAPIAYIMSALTAQQSCSNTVAMCFRYVHTQNWWRNTPGMPEEEAEERAREDEREGKSPSTQAGEFVREEMEHIREGEHGARSPEQAIAIGPSKARRAGVELPTREACSGSTPLRDHARPPQKKGLCARESAIAKKYQTELESGNHRRFG
jgi:hypothetical protein